MVTIEQRSGERGPDAVTRRRLARVAVYLVVIAAGLGLGALIGAIGALCMGLITITC